MAEIVVSAAVTVLIEKLLSGELLKLAKYEGIDSQLKKWKEKLILIQNVLADADQTYITQQFDKEWLHRLRELAYDIDDVVDDLATEVIKRKLNQETHATSSKLLKLFPACCTNLHPHNMIYGHKMKSKVEEITSRLNDLADERNKLGLLGVNVKAKIGSKGKNVQTSLIDRSTVLGREADAEALIAKLLEDEDLNQKVSVMSIVGLGGIGKTTLAKLLYNDEKVKDHFELRAWVYVSQEFDVLKISKAIYRAVNGEEKDFDDLDLLHVALKEKLSKKRFLVALDDVWNEDQNQCELLKSVFFGGYPGSKIIVTTRKRKVALMMGSFQLNDLKPLSNEIAMSLLLHNALDEENIEKYPSLKVIAQGIINKCDGLPLALVAVGRVLKIKGSSDDEWQEVLDSEIWDIGDGNILPALELSYYDLPPHLKQVFAYCSFFPKGYLFNKEELVLLWMAEGFLSQSKGSNHRMESMGRNYFEELTSRSFFQHSMDDETKYTMHDMMNDLARSVAGEFFFMLDDKTDENDGNYDFEKFRHFSFGLRSANYKKFKELDRSRCLRTFLPASVGQNYWTTFDTLDHVLPDLLSRLQLLRVLSLPDRLITHVPKSIGDLKHLRYLNFSRTWIKQIPEEVSELYNLQSLLVSECRELVSLPTSFSKLTNLRHLEMSYTPYLNDTPLGIGRLKSLQTLTKVHIEGGNGFNVSDLKDLLYLEGHLSIKGLDKVIHTQQALDAGLKGKKGLVSLDMEWSDVLNDFRNPEVEYKVIQSLRPHTRLNKLKILSYGGMKFPSWFGDTSFDKLTELWLYGCKNCTDFDNISFPSLEYLKIINMPGLEKWSNCDGDKTNGSLPHLREIHINDCPKLAELSIRLIQSLEVNVGSGNKKYVKRKVNISDCDSLESFSCHNTVEKLYIISCSSLTTLQQELPSSLKSLKVKKCIKLVSIGEKDVNVGSSNTKSVLRKVIFQKCESLESYSCPNSVEDLFISECSSMKSLTMQEVNIGSSSMKPITREVNISGCNSLECYNCPNNVEKLHIYYCDSMTSLTFSRTELELPSSLKFFRLRSCKSLKSFPLLKHLQNLISLEYMWIQDCRSLDDSFPCGLWPPNLRILGIGELKKPMSTWGLQDYPNSLVRLELVGSDSGVTSFAMERDAINTASTSFLLPPSLTSLEIIDFKDVESITGVVLQLTHLRDLTIASCPNVKEVPESTSSLRVDDRRVFERVDGDNQDFASLDLLHVALKEKLADKRFLVVLDDVWNEDHSQWDLLKSPFLVGSIGSKVIVTTRKNKVALVMDSAQPHMLEVLFDEKALSLFAYNALNEENFDKYPSLKVTAQGIICYKMKPP
ncbi:putative disease resistance RPP13-like protein 1 [Rutidosis leptorrhynchoides]|uniref:putative disease resistance RPP13-like protein 1 n=1 Tax=Rutidosis leptorrhynchoides TaxID=125765 RepID=UPI003A9998C0